MTVSEGSTFPQGVKFNYVPYTPEDSDVLACGVPISMDLDKEIAGKKVVLVAVPGAFTPTCTANHIPPFLEKINELKSKGVDEVIVLSANDPFVMSAWGKALHGADKVKFVSDPNSQFAKANGLDLDLTDKGMGVRVKRFAAIVDKGKVTYIGVDPQGVEKSGVDAVVAKL